jgi:amino acid transporter
MLVLTAMLSLGRARIGAREQRHGGHQDRRRAAVHRGRRAPREPANWQPFMPSAMNGTMSAAALVFFAFIGFDAVTSAAEEVKRPSATCRSASSVRWPICTVLYVIVSAIMTGIVPFQKFKGIDHPVSLACSTPVKTGSPASSTWAPSSA